MDTPVAHGPAHHLGADATFEVGGVGVHVGELDVAEGPGPEGGHLVVQAGADAADLALGDPRPRPQGGHQVVDLAGGHPVHVGLHHHREQSPVDAPAPLEDGREERSPAQLGDLEIDIARLGGQQTVSAPVALVGAGVAALVEAGADHLGDLGLDEGLEHEFHALADDVDVAAGADRVEQAGHVRLGEGHWESPSALFGRKAEDLPVTPPQWWMVPASTPLGGTSTSPEL
jgi:hypothetical protein